MRSLSSIASGLVLSYLYFSLLLIPSAEATITIRQAPTPSATTGAAAASTALSIPGQTNIMQVLLPAARTLIAAPLKIMHQLYLEIRAFLATHNFRQMFDVGVINQLVTVVPKRIQEYWVAFHEVETACVRRTLCDLADHTSKRVPHWFNQILTIYFTTFSQNSQYYQAVLNGLVSHNCPAVYPDCDPSAFMNRLTGNVGQSFNATVAPVREAFANLMAVTAATIDTVASGGMSGILNNPQQRPSPPVAPAAAASAVERIDDERREQDGRRPAFNEADNEEESFREDQRRPSRPPVARFDRMPAMNGRF